MNRFSFTLLLICGLFSCSGAADITDVDDYDPGTCDKTNLLQVVSVKDRNDNKKLWICQQEHGNYLWKAVNGEAFVGGFLQPAYDCSDILKHKADAQSGFYWVTIKTKTKRKVWCDMTTDGGGYMLVARKHDAAAWDVPSKDKPADPQSSDKYWTSQLGDAPILDFRIQLSTNDSFDDTKAQWSYRLKNRRPLGKLMITDRGCSNLTPGIGDIAFVKDLMADKIVTTTFNCSVFGSPLSVAFGKLGWSMMNECLKKPCKGSGYLHRGKEAIRLEPTGVFSYSASNAKSGMHHDATAYIGCLQNKCCGCFGPLGGTGNYCNTKCNGSLGGTVVESKKLFTWIWVRSSLPKRIWNRCMEFQKQESNGQNEWYSLIGDSVIPQKGRCSNPESLRLNSGVVVVPDSTAAKKVPEIPGLLEYRKDIQQLYLRANETWQSLSDNKEVNNKLSVIEQNVDKSLAETKENITALNRILKQSVDVELADVKQNLTQIIAILKLFNQFTHAKILANYPQCSTYTWLTEGDRYYGFQSSTNQKCDSHLSGWYRFGGAAGKQMYTSCQSYYYCNTNYPGYLSGSHPGVNDGIVTRKVCFRYNYRYGSQCCYYSRSIKVLNCGSYYVYELKGTPTCNARYCGS